MLLTGDKLLAISRWDDVRRLLYHTHHVVAFCIHICIPLHVYYYVCKQTCIQTSLHIRRTYRKKILLPIPLIWIQLQSSRVSNAIKISFKHLVTISCVVVLMRFAINDCCTTCILSDLQLFYFNMISFYF